MYIKASEAHTYICHRTISPDNEGKPCKGVKCSAFETVMENYITVCPACEHKITPAELEGEEWGRCTAKWRYS